MRPLCRHCQQKPANRPRRMCWTCYYTDGVRSLYPSTSKFARRGVRDRFGRQTLPEPTCTLPGSEGKLKVLESRARAGEELFHPRDSQHSLL